AAASRGVKGGTSRVFTSPVRGALAISPSAQTRVDILECVIADPLLYLTENSASVNRLGASESNDAGLVSGAQHDHTKISAGSLTEPNKITTIYLRR
ncbi:MAG TPA: hypothetical protein VIF64_14000, partial [Pyrinomonadaceae bacterium]